MSTPKKTGRRKVTGADAVNAELVKRYSERKDHPTKIDMFNILSDGGKYLDITRTAHRLLDVLLRSTHAHDWNGGPLTVWQSNESLMIKLDVTERTIQNAFTELKEKNIVTFFEHPSGHRYGRRDPDTGLIIEAFGPDLRPFAERAEAITLMMMDEARAHQKQRDKRKRLSARLKRLAEMIISGKAIAGDRKEWSHYEKTYEKIDDQYRQVKYPDENLVNHVLSLALPLYQDVETLLGVVTRSALRITGLVENRTPTDEKDCTHKTTTNPQLSKDNAVPLWEEKREAAAKQPTPQLTFNEPLRSEQLNQHLQQHSITPEFLIRACPNYVDYLETIAGKTITASWADFHSAAKRILHDFDAADHAISNMNRTLGTIGLSVTAAYMYERNARSINREDKTIKSFGAYLHYIANAAKTGTIDLGPKIHSLVDKKYRKKKEQYV